MCVEGSAAVNASAIPLAVRGPTAEQHKLDACDACLLQQSNTKLMPVTLVCYIRAPQNWCLWRLCAAAEQHKADGCDACICGRTTHVHGCDTSLGKRG